MSSERCSGDKNKSKEDCTVFATGSWKMVWKSSLSALRWKDKLSIVTLVLTCTKMKSPQSSYKKQAKISLTSCCSKILKWGLSDFTSTCFRNLKNWKGSIAVWDGFERDIIFIKEDTKGDNVFETALKLDQNSPMVLWHWRTALI